MKKEWESVKRARVRKTYDAYIRCDNCYEKYCFTVLKGVRVADHKLPSTVKCVNCGCEIETDRVVM